MPTTRAANVVMKWYKGKRRRYGQPHVIAQACEERLRAFPSMLDKDPEVLNKLAC